MKKSKGMTLVEVMVALGVFALSAGAIINVIMNATNNVTFLEDQFWAQIVAENVLSEQKIKKAWPNNSWVSDEYELADRTWYYRYRGQETQDTSFKALEVEVFDTKISDKVSPIIYLKTYVSR